MQIPTHGNTTLKICSTCRRHSRANGGAWTKRLQVHSMQSNFSAYCTTQVMLVILFAKNVCSTKMMSSAGQASASTHGCMLHITQWLDALTCYIHSWVIGEAIVRGW